MWWNAFRLQNYSKQTFLQAMQYYVTKIVAIYFDGLQQKENIDRLVPERPN